MQVQLNEVEHTNTPMWTYEDPPHVGRDQLSRPKNVYMEDEEDKEE